MNALNRNRIALLAGGALVAVAATGCSSSAKSAASGAPATSSATTSAASSAATAPSTPAAPGPPTVTVTAPGGVTTTTAQAGGASTAPAAAGDGNGAPADHPVCDNAKVNASLAPRIAGQSDSVFVIAVKNVGPTCTLGPIPYVWIEKSPTDASDSARPLIPSVDTGKKNIIVSGTTLYAAVDLLPGVLATATGDYSDLAVTASSDPNDSGKDVQDVQLPSALPAGGAKLGVYALTPASAIDQIQYATTPEQ
jgi:hypothetical protein